MSYKKLKLFWKPQTECVDFKFSCFELFFQFSLRPHPGDEMYCVHYGDCANERLNCFTICCRKGD